MRKMTLALAALATSVAATLAAGTSLANAQGSRGGFGYGQVYTPTIGARPMADSSIMERARLQNERNKARRTGQSYGPAVSERRNTNSAFNAGAAAAAKRETAARAAQARAEKAAAADDARRQARAVAQKATQAAAQAKAKSAAAATSASAAARNQEAERARAEVMPKGLSVPSQTASQPTTAAPVMPSATVATPGLRPAPVAAPVASPATAPATAAAPECTRFLPAASITVRVPCSE